MLLSIGTRPSSSRRILASRFRERSIVGPPAGTPKLHAASLRSPERTSGTVPASPAGGDANASVPIRMGFVYTFDGAGKLVVGFGSTNGGPPDPTPPLGMQKATGTYTIDASTCSGMEEILVHYQGRDFPPLHRWFALSAATGSSTSSRRTPASRFKACLTNGTSGETTCTTRRNRGYLRAA